jgi:hypothetical protein
MKTKTALRTIQTALIGFGILPFTAVGFFYIAGVKSYEINPWLAISIWVMDAIYAIYVVFALRSARKQPIDHQIAKTLATTECQNHTRILEAVQAIKSTAQSTDIARVIEQTTMLEDYMKQVLKAHIELQESL